ncbi:MAG: hypothetical protein AAB432_01295 [Patescibacteria group bacterium]
MNFALVYLVQQFFYRIFDFFYHWYIKSGRFYSNIVLNRLEKLDYYFAWRITLKNLFQPLYKDYSIIGYVLGFFFRLLRLLITSVIYAFIFIFAAGLYLLWLAAPIYLIAKTFSG